MNVCIYRIPLKKSIISPPSTCPHCGERIKFYDNIPLLSYLLLSGRCRRCNHPVSWRYPIVEGLTGLLSLALFIRYGFSYQYILAFLFAATLVTISLLTLTIRSFRISFRCPGSWQVGGFISPGSPFWLDSLIGAVAGGGTLFLVAFIYERITGREGMGGGDIKLLAMIGAWMGWRSLPLIVLISSLTGAVIGSIFILFAGKGYRVRIPFGPFLSLGALFTSFWQ